MNNRWTDAGEEDALKRWGDPLGEALTRRLYTARLLGEDRTLAMHGGGNVSLKGTISTPLGDVEGIFVKASGCDLSGLDRCDLPVLDLDRLRRLRSIEHLDDGELHNQLRLSLLDAGAPTPSIEALMHALLPHRYVDHTHPDALLALANRKHGAELVHDALGDRAAILTYVRPGVELALAVAGLHESNPNVEGIVLLHHGLVTFGDDARTAYDRHIALVDTCERYLKQRAKRVTLAKSFSPADTPETLAVRAAPILRGLLALPTGDADRPFHRSIIAWRGGSELLEIINSKQAESLAMSGPLTGDEVVRTKPAPMFVANPPWGDEAALAARLRESVDAYAVRYKEYVLAHGGDAEHVDAMPNVVILPGAGLFARGRTLRQARAALDLAERTLMIKVRSDELGPYVPLSGDHLFDVEHRAMQRSKVDAGDARPLSGQVVVISGGAGAIGTAIARVCAIAGAHVAVTDVNEQRLGQVVKRIESLEGEGCTFGCAMDVTNESSVRDGYAEIVRRFGGVDVIVPNAGIAHCAAIDTMEVDAFRRVMEVNATGYLLFMQAGIRILKAQGTGGNIVINASKNVFGPGKEFGAYSASKAAGHQLGKVAAIELAPMGIRVNMINADAIFEDEDGASGLWAAVGPDRAAARGMEASDLPEYYRKRNLLKSQVRGEHVGNAVVFFASNLTPTTGATLPVDGGVIDAFPR